VKQLCHYTDAQSERKRIIQAAVEVTDEDISTRIYDNESYSSLDEMFDDAQMQALIF